MAWGNKIESPLITDLLRPNFIGWGIKGLFAINLVFSYPLILYPAHIVVENYLYHSWPKSKKRQWSKNFTRALLVAFTVVVTIAMQHKVDKFLGILGAVSCTPIAFTFPALFHYKAAAETT